MSKEDDSRDCKYFRYVLLKRRITIWRIRCFVINVRKLLDVPDAHNQGYVEKNRMWRPCRIFWYTLQKGFVR